MNIDNSKEDDYNSQNPWPIPEWVDLTSPRSHSEGDFSKLATCWDPDHVGATEYDSDDDSEYLKHLANKFGSEHVKHLAKAEVEERFEKFLLMPVVQPNLDRLDSEKEE